MVKIFRGETSIEKQTFERITHKERKIEMKKTLLLTTMTILVLGLGFGVAYAHMGHGYGVCNGCEYGYGYPMGPGHDVGPGMMVPGYDYGYWPQYGYGRQYSQASKPMTENQVKQEVENYLSSTRNPNLKMGKIKDKGNDYEVNIETKNGSLANKILVSKDTGWLRSAY
jgi:hypothetical protein